jgi:hypothetical protein
VAQATIKYLKTTNTNIKVYRSLKNRESMLAMWMSTQFVYVFSKYSLEEILTEETIAENGVSGLAMWKNCVL